MTDFQYGLLIGASIAFVWMFASCLAVAWWSFVRGKEEQAFEDSFNYRPHREGNIVAFRRR